MICNTVFYLTDLLSFLISVDMLLNNKLRLSLMNNFLFVFPSLDKPWKNSGKGSLFPHLHYAVLHLI